jgi:hypothetical protein
MKSAFKKMYTGISYQAWNNGAVSRNALPIALSTRMTMIQKTLGSTAVLTLLSMSGAMVAAAQTTTPGTPDTGAGGDPFMNVLVLAAAALVAVSAGGFLLRRTEQRG